MSFISFRYCYSEKVLMQDTLAIYKIREMCQPSWNEVLFYQITHIFSILNSNCTENKIFYLGLKVNIF